MCVDEVVEACSCSAVEFVDLGMPGAMAGRDSSKVEAPDGGVRAIAGLIDGCHSLLDARELPIGCAVGLHVCLGATDASWSDHLG